MSTPHDPSRVPAGVTTGGRFAREHRADASVSLTSPAQRAVGDMVDRGVLSPAARDMDPADAIEQHAEASALSLREKADLLATAGLPVRLAARDVCAGDRIFPADDGSSFEVMSVDELGSVVRIEYDDPHDQDELKEWSIGADDQIAVLIGDGASRCPTCGLERTDWGAPCEECDDAKA